MGLFSKKVSPARFELVFGPNFSASISTAYQQKAQSIKINFPQDLMKQIEEAIGLHRFSTNVLYEDEMQFLDVVGEAQNQEELLRILRRDESDSEEMDLERGGSDWYAGFLMPEPFNKFDTNAVKVLLIDPNSETDTYEVVPVGYLPRESAKSVSKTIMRFLDDGKVIPLLLKIVGGTKEKPGVGVIARAKTKAIRF